jgi:hypothetical protein
MMMPPAGPPPVCPNPRDGLHADTYSYPSSTVPIDSAGLAPILLGANPQRIDFYPTGEALQALALGQSNFGTKFTGFIQVGLRFTAPLTTDVNQNGSKPGMTAQRTQPPCPSAWEKSMWIWRQGQLMHITKCINIYVYIQQVIGGSYVFELTYQGGGASLSIAGSPGVTLQVSSAAKCWHTKHPADAVQWHDIPSTAVRGICTMHAHQSTVVTAD